jgi:hypothetical protein
LPPAPSAAIDKAVDIENGEKNRLPASLLSNEYVLNVKLLMLLAILEALALEYCLGVVTAAIGVSVTAGMAVTVGVTVIVGVGVGVGITPCFPIHPEKRTTNPTTVIKIIDLNCTIDNATNSLITNYIKSADLLS